MILPYPTVVVMLGMDPGLRRWCQTDPVGRTSLWGVSPQQSIESECDRRGRSALISGCQALLRGERVDPELLLALGGPAAAKFVADPERIDSYWMRVWGARGLLWAWDDSAACAIELALRDDAWRVREMAARVVARHRLGSLVREVSLLLDDDVLRVRAAADRALVLLTAAGA